MPTPWQHPVDQTDPQRADERAFDELTPTEQRAALAELPHADVVEQCLAALDDAALHQRMYRRSEAARLQACRELDEAGDVIIALRAELRWLGINPSQVVAA